PQRSYRSENRNPGKSRLLGASFRHARPYYLAHNAVARCLSPTRAPSYPSRDSISRNASMVDVPHISSVAISDDTDRNACTAGITARLGTDGATLAGSSFLRRTATRSRAASVAILGAGNGGMALAGFLALRGHRVALWNRSAERVDPVVSQGGIRLTLPESA